MILIDLVLFHLPTMDSFHFLTTAIPKPLLNNALTLFGSISKAIEHSKIAIWMLLLFQYKRIRALNGVLTAVALLQKSLILTAFVKD